jgi:hypothetical protein
METDGKIEKPGHEEKLNCLDTTKEKLKWESSPPRVYTHDGFKP